MTHSVPHSVLRSCDAAVLLGLQPLQWCEAHAIGAWHEAGKDAGCSHSISEYCGARCFSVFSRCVRLARTSVALVAHAVSSVSEVSAFVAEHGS